MPEKITSDNPYVLRSVIRLTTKWVGNGASSSRARHPARGRYPARLSPARAKGPRPSGRRLGWCLSPPLRRVGLPYPM
jgi:hypothetical protein